MQNSTFANLSLNNRFAVGVESAFDDVLAKILALNLITIAYNFNPDNLEQNHGNLRLLELPSMNLCNWVICQHWILAVNLLKSVPLKIVKIETLFQSLVPSVLPLLRHQLLFESNSILNKVNSMRALWLNLILLLNQISAILFQIWHDPFSGSQGATDLAEIVGALGDALRRSIGLVRIADVLRILPRSIWPYQ